MVAITPVTRIKIKAYLEVFIDNLVHEYKGRKIPTLGTPTEYLAQTSSKGQLKPFHSAIIPEELLRINEFERGFSTSLGTTYEECARLIALDHHADARRSHDLQSEISDLALNEIERQIAVFDRAASTDPRKKPDFEEMIKAVLAAKDTGTKSGRSVRADLFIKTKDGIEFYFELKGPGPNKGQCLEVTQRLLRFHLLRGEGPPKVRALWAMPYNPYGPERKHYKWGFARQYTPFDQAIVIGQEFWALAGGPTAYEELLDIYQEVGREKSKHMLDSLAFDF